MRRTVMSAITPGTAAARTTSVQRFAGTSRGIQHNSQTSDSRTSTSAQTKEGDKPVKSIAELDKELVEKLAGRASDGGSAAIEYEDGKPVAMKRSVKNNMFRYI